MKSEHRVQNEIRNALAGEMLLFRANVGQAWTGSKVTRLPDGSVLIENARPFNTGLPKGFADLFGVVQTTIRPEHVGQVFGRFVAMEVKSAKGRASEAQSGFLAAVSRNGGISGVVRCADDARELISGD